MKVKAVIFYLELSAFTETNTSMKLNANFPSIQTSRAIINTAVWYIGEGGKVTDS